MALRIPVYVSCINNLSDARYCAGMGVKWLGFSSDDIDQEISENDILGILEWVEGIESVLELRSDKKLNLDLKFDSTLHSIENYSGAKTDFLEINIEDIKSLDYGTIEFDYLVVRSGNNEDLNEEIKAKLLELNKNIRLILAFGIQEEALNWIENELKPAGIMLEGGKEIRPGLKTFDELADILEFLEEDN